MQLRIDKLSLGRRHREYVGLGLADLIVISVCIGGYFGMIERLSASEKLESSTCTHLHMAAKHYCTSATVHVWALRYI
jgi:hypothetical protein